MKLRTRRRIVRHLRVGAVLSALALCACGSQLPHVDHVAMAGGAAAPQSGVGQGATGLGAVVPSGDSGIDPATGQPAAVGSPGAETPGAQSSVTGSAGTPAGGHAPVASGTPVRIGMIGNFTGVVGSTVAPARDAFLAWVAMVNDGGGVNGHPIELVVGDDGNDASRSLAIAQDFVENRDVAALVNVWPADMRPLAEYAQAQGVPVIGGASNSVPEWNQFPLMFPQAASNRNSYRGMAVMAQDTGASRVGVVFCTEAAACRVSADIFTASARDLGMEVVYEGAVSLAQPDFTAECINARSAGAEAILTVLDGGSTNRFAQSCARQDYRPSIVVPAPNAAIVGDLEGAIALIPSIPWFMTSGSPAVEEFASAMATYQPNATLGGFTGMGWAAGKLVERAIAGAQGEPTRDALIASLVTMEGDSLGGVTAPLTFRREEPAPEATCGFVLRVEGGQWTSPNGLELGGCA